jgi:hypothetical protein
MIATSKCAIKNIETYLIFSTLSLVFFPHTVTILLIWHVIIPHIYAPILFFIHFWRQHAALVAIKHSNCSGGDVRLSTLSESSQYRPVRTRSVTSNILAQQRRRNGTETWRRRSCLCEHLRLITHEKILLNGDVPRRNGNVTYSVNRH